MLDTRPRLQPSLPSLTTSSTRHMTVRAIAFMASIPCVEGLVVQPGTRFKPKSGFRFGSIVLQASASRFDDETIRASCKDDLMRRTIQLQIRSGRCPGLALFYIPHFSALSSRAYCSWHHASFSGRGLAQRAWPSPFLLRDFLFRAPRSTAESRTGRASTALAAVPRPISLGHALRDELRSSSADLVPATCHRVT